MELPDENNFAEVFFKRTVYNLNLYNNENKLCKERFQYEVTQLVNSLLGLVVFVKEDNINFSSIELNSIIEVDTITWRYCDRQGGSLEEKQRINTMVHLGARAFEEIGGEVVESVAFVLEKGE